MGTYRRDSLEAPQNYSLERVVAKKQLWEREKELQRLSAFTRLNTKARLSDLSDSLPIFKYVSDF